MQQGTMGKDFGKHVDECNVTLPLEVMMMCQP